MSFIPIESRLRKLGFSHIAGIDEAGRGPMAGPVVSAIVILKKNAKLLGLNDSKLVSPKKRTELFDFIIKNAIDYSITAVSHINVDKWNIANATKEANVLCINALKIKPDFILVDGRERQNIDIPYQTVIKGDRRIRTIAAASILAKVARDRIMERFSKEFPKYRFEKHMGYGTREHRSLMEKHGLCEIHRKTYNWRVTKKK